MKKNDIDCIWTDKKRTIFGLPLSFTRYYMTQEKLIRRRGFLSIIEDEFELYRVSDKKLRLSLAERIFGCGTIVIHVKDVDTPIFEMDSIKKPRHVMKIFEENVNSMRDKYNIRGRDMIGTRDDE